MKEILEFFTEFSLQTIVAVVAAMWYFTRDLKREMHEIRDEMGVWRKEHREDITLQAERSDKLYQMFVDLLSKRK